MTYTGEWVCDECGHRSMDEHAPCDCEDTCTEHVKTIDRLRSQLRATRLSDDDREALLWLRGHARAMETSPHVAKVHDRALAVLSRLIGDDK